MLLVQKNQHRAVEWQLCVHISIHILSRWIMLGKSSNFSSFSLVYLEKRVIIWILSSCYSYLDNRTWSSTTDKWWMHGTMVLLWFLLLSISFWQTKQSVAILSGRSACSHKMLHLLPASFILENLRLPVWLFLESDQTRVWVPTLPFTNSIIMN